MTQKSIVISIACFLFIGIFTFLVWSTVLYYQQKDDFNKAWQNGYDTALSAKSEYEETIKQLQSEKLNLSTELADTKANIESLTASNSSYQTQVAELTKQKQALQSSVEDLTQTKTDNELTISTLNTKVSSYETQISDLQDEITEKSNQIKSLNTQIANLNSEIEELENDVANNTAEIAALQQQKLGLENQITNLNSQISTKTQQINTLNNNITSLNNLVSQLQSTNDLQAQTIANLNTQIVSLNTQISNLILQINNNSGLVSTLNQKITQLENSIAYYEEYIAGLENGTQIVVTAEFNGSVYNVQVINKGGKVSLVEPKSTDDVIFNYWQLENGTQIDLSTYTFNESTKIIANVTYKYDVDFYVDNVSISDDIIVANSFATPPSNPSKSGYEFDGWSLDGSTVIDVSSYAITKNTIFYAVFTKLHTVQFNDGTQVIDTQTVRNGEYAENVNIENTTYKVFNGWTVAGSIINVDSYVISTDTVFTASYTYKYDVIFKVDETTHNSQIIASGNFASEPTIPTKTGYTFKGWSKDGQNVVNLNSTSITATTTFIAIFEINSYTVNFVDGSSTLYTQQVNYNSSPVEPSVPTKDGYIFEGWSLNGSDIVTVTSQVITDNTTFIAVFSEANTVTFQGIFGPVYGTLDVRVGDKITVPDSIVLEEREHYVFLGWTLSNSIFGGDIVDLNTYIPTSDISLYPVYEQYEWSFTVYDGNTILFQEWYELDEEFTINVSPIGIDGYNFINWKADSILGVSQLPNYKSFENVKLTGISANVVYRSYYASVMAGEFVTDDEKFVLTLIHHSTDLIVSTGYSGYPDTSSCFRNPSFSIDLENRSFTVTDGSITYNGLYDSDNDCWLVTNTYTQETYTLNRLLYGNGIAGSLIDN